MKTLLPVILPLVDLFLVINIGGFSRSGRGRLFLLRLYKKHKVFSDFTLINVVQNDLCLRTSTPADQTLARDVLDGRVQVDAFQLEDSVICSCGLSPVCRLQLSVSPCADAAIIVVVVSTLTTSMAATKGATRKNDLLYELLT